MTGNLSARNLLTIVPYRHIIQRELEKEVILVNRPVRFAPVKS